MNAEERIFMEAESYSLCRDEVWKNGFRLGADWMFQELTKKIKESGKLDEDEFNEMFNNWKATR